MKTLTKRQKEILNFLEEWISKKGYSPTFREIMHHFNFSSVGTVVSHMSALSNKGYIQSEPKKRRSLVPVQKNPDSKGNPEIELPFVGMIQASFPIEMYPDTKVVKVPSAFVRFPESPMFCKCGGKFGIGIDARRRSAPSRPGGKLKQENS